MSFTVQPFVGEEKLWELLREKAESESLDYKSRLDIRQTKDLCQLAKDIGAMQVAGGYVVVGVDNQGEPTGDMPDELLPLYDEARLRAKLLKYLPDNLTVLSAVHQVDGKNVVLIYVAQNPDGFAIFRSDGNYSGGYAFRQGDVYARHGSASEPWSQEDARRIVANLVAAEKEDWFAERRAELQAEREAAERADTAGRLARDAPAQALSWELDSETLKNMVIDQLRRDDDIPLRLFFNEIVRDADACAQNTDISELEILLDRLSCLAVLFLEVERLEWFQRVIASLVRIYDLGFDERGLDKNLPVGRARFWLALVARVVAIGAFAVRHGHWQQVRYLATQVGRGYDFRGQEGDRYQSWLRHAVTMAARANLLDEDSLISWAHSVVQNEECLRPDLEPEDDRLLTSICQFDALAMVATISASKRLNVYYPTFSRYYEHRTQPALAALLSDNEMREAIFPADDAEYANVIRYIDHIARQEGWRFGGWDSLHNERLRQLLEANPEQAH